MHVGSSLKEEQIQLQLFFFKLVAFSGVNSNILTSAHFLLSVHLSKWLKQS